MFHYPGMLGRMNIFEFKQRSEVKRIVFAAMVGAISAGVQLLVFNLLRHIVFPELANLIAIEIAIINNFILNHKITFSTKIKAKYKTNFYRFCKFNMVAVGSFLIQTTALFIGLRCFGRGFFIENALVIIGMCLGFGFNYMGYRFLIWKND